jgi:hypothetical protein
VVKAFQTSGTSDEATAHRHQWQIASEMSTVIAAALASELPHRVRTSVDGTSERYGPV